MLDTWLTSVRDALRTILGRPKLQLAFPDGVCALDLGDGRRPRIDELSRGHRTAIELFAELTLRVEAARRRAGDLGLEPPGLALIDGIERDLDPRLQRELLPLLARRVPNVQLVVTTSSPLAAIALDDAVVLDLGAHELRMTTTLRNEGLPQLVDRLVGAPPPAPVRKSSFPPPAQLPPRTTRPGGGFGDD
ncbi:MAG: AAA family ATPase [Sandaracinaceae bacterium]